MIRRHRNRSGRQLPPELKANNLFRAENDDSRNPILQLTYISRPFPLLQGLHCMGTQVRYRTTKIPGKLTQQILAKLRYILAALSKGQQTNTMDKTP